MGLGGVAGGEKNGTHLKGGIKLDAHKRLFLRDFPKIIVHEVWVGNIIMTPGVCLFVCLFGWLVGWLVGCLVVCSSTSRAHDTSDS